MIESVAARASEIVRQLMVYAGEESSSVELVDLAAVVREMLPLIQVSLSKTAAFEIHLPDGLPKIRANLAQIRQVLLNLLTNASEALGGKERIITVRLTKIGPRQELGEGAKRARDGHYLRLDICDTGCGMTDPIRFGMFDSFFTTKGAGRGLGLSAVQGIVRSHGCNISVISSPGRGSRFEVFLPCADKLEEVPDGGIPTSANSGQTFTGTVLMIEDEQPLRGALAKLLRAKGLHVLEAGDGKAAVELSRNYSSKIDVAAGRHTAWIVRPGRFGKLREDRPTMKVIVSSAYGRDQALATVNGELSQPYIRKPYRVNELLELIRTTCQHRVNAEAAHRSTGNRTWSTIRRPLEAKGSEAGASALPELAVGSPVRIPPYLCLLLSPTILWPAEILGGEAFAPPPGWLMKGGICVVRCGPIGSGLIVVTGLCARSH